jgi:hypothetical protein
LSLQQAEEAFRAQLEARLTERRQIVRPGGKAGVQYFEQRSRIGVDCVRLEGECPDTLVVIAFHLLDRPECRFAWQHPLWNKRDYQLGTPDSDDLICVYFAEDLDRRPHFSEPCVQGERRVGVVSPVPFEMRDVPPERSRVD